ncbi:MAG: protein translocase subunit SecF, partial [Patescibacteria group bacterium]
ERGAILRFKEIDEAIHQKVVSTINEKWQMEEKRFESIGPTIGAELKRKAIFAIILAAALIILYIAWAFRKVSWPVSSWKYGVCAILALIHDVTIPTGVFSLLGHYRGVEVDGLFITALLTILGFSVHDTIVVFDRVRENLKNAPKERFEDTVSASVNQTIGRSINTSLTVLLVLSAIYFFGGETIKNFALALILGVSAGTYSSIFIASPLLVSWHLLSQKRAVIQRKK